MNAAAAPLTRRMVGAAPAQNVSVSSGSSAQAFALAGGLLTVKLPSNARQVSYSATAGVQSQIPLGGTTQQFILSGSVGVITIAWMPAGSPPNSFGASATVTLNPYLAPIKVPPQKPLHLIPIHVITGSGGVTAGAPFALQQGHRYATTTKVSTGQLPADYQNQTVASLQAQVQAAGIAANIVSVKYSPDGKALFVEEDHCGPTTMTSSPYDVTDGGVIVTTTYTDMGPASTCSAGMSKGAKIALSVGAVALVAGGAWWVLS